MSVKYYLREREGDRERKKKKERGQSSSKEKERATVTIFFYPFLDHVTKTQMWDIQTDQSADYSFTRWTKDETINRPAMYTHDDLQASITISTHVPLGMTNSPFVTQDRFGTGKQKSEWSVFLCYGVLIVVFSRCDCETHTHTHTNKLFISSRHFLLCFHGSYCLWMTSM